MTPEEVVEHAAALENLYDNAEDEEHAAQLLSTMLMLRRHARATTERPAGTDLDQDLASAMYDVLEDAVRARGDIPVHQYADIEAMAAVAQRHTAAELRRLADVVPVGPTRTILLNEADRIEGAQP